MSSKGSSHIAVAQRSDYFDVLEGVDLRNYSPNIVLYYFYKLFITIIPKKNKYKQQHQGYGAISQNNDKKTLDASDITNVRQNGTVNSRLCEAKRNLYHQSYLHKFCCKTFAYNKFYLKRRPQSLKNCRRYCLTIRQH